MVAARKAVIYLAGDEAACKKAERAVAGFADSCLYFGKFGAASRVKLVNNLLVAINIAATAEAMALGLKAGVDVDLMIKAIATGSGGSTQFGIRAPWMAQRRFTPPQGTVPTLQHYFGMIGDFADSVGVATPLLDRAAPSSTSASWRWASASSIAPRWSMSSPRCRVPRPKTQTRLEQAITEAPHDPRQEDRPRVLRNAGRGQAGRILHRHHGPLGNRQGQGRGLSRLHRRSPLGGTAQGAAGEMRAHRLPDRARRRPQRVREAGPGPRHQDRRARRIPSRRLPRC